MKSQNWILGLLLGVTLLGFPAHAKENDANPFRWLTEAQELALSNSIPPPPAPGSEVDKADLATILAVQKSRTPEVIAECKRDEKYSYRLFESVYGSNLNAENSPKFIQMMKDGQATTHQVNDVAKKRFMRKRPYVGHPEVVKSVFTVNGWSYPSGHSMGSFTMAIILGAIFPEKKQAFLDRAAQIAQSRVDAGVHYPSDIKEGEALGKETGAEILKSPAFQADLAAVQAELKK